MTKACLIAVAALLGVGGPGAAGGLGPDGWESLSEPLEPFTVRDTDGKALRSSDLAGRVVAIDFWATWCAPCVRELPGLIEYHDRIEGRKDVALLSFNVGDTGEAIAEFAQEHEISFPIYRADELAEKLGVYAFPTKLIIDFRDGAKLRYRRLGYAPADVLEPRVEALLAEKP